MKFIKILALISILLTATGITSAADSDKSRAQFPNDANGDVLRRMQSSGFDFTKPHDVEFFAVFRTEKMADSVAMEFVADSKAGDKYKAINTKPATRGGMELRLVKSMLVTYENVTAVERKLAKRVSKHDGYMDGWGVFQQ